MTNLKFWIKRASGRDGVESMSPSSSSVGEPFAFADDPTGTKSLSIREVGVLRSAKREEREREVKAAVGGMKPEIQIEIRSMLVMNVLKLVIFNGLGNYRSPRASLVLVHLKLYADYCLKEAEASSSFVCVSSAILFPVSYLPGFVLTSDDPMKNYRATAFALVVLGIHLEIRVLRTFCNWYCTYCTNHLRTLRIPHRMSRQQLTVRNESQKEITTPLPSIISPLSWLPPMNFEKYPWLSDLSSSAAATAIEAAKQSYRKTGAATFPNILTDEALESCVQDAREQEDAAFTTDDVHTAYLRPVDPNFDLKSVKNFEMRTKVASIAFDELPKDSKLSEFYKQPTLRELVAKIIEKEEIYLSDDPLGCCSINVFRPGYHHSFHFDESEFSTTLMLQESSIPGTGLFQYTNPLREVSDDLALSSVAKAISDFDSAASEDFIELDSEKDVNEIPLHTLEFVPGTLSVFAGSKSLHRVTKVKGNCSRLVAVLTFASEPGFKNTPAVQKLFWGRSAQ